MENDSFNDPLAVFLPPQTKSFVRDFCPQVETYEEWNRNSRARGEGLITVSENDLEFWATMIRDELIKELCAIDGIGISRAKLLLSLGGCEGDGIYGCSRAIRAWAYARYMIQYMPNKLLEERAPANQKRADGLASTQSKLPVVPALTKKNIIELRAWLSTWRGDEDPADVDWLGFW